MGAFEILCAGGEEVSSHLEDKLAVSGLEDENDRSSLARMPEFNALNRGGGFEETPLTSPTFIRDFGY